MTDRSATAADALVKSVTVSVDVQQAFDMFTSQMAAWWPMATHSVGQAEAMTVTLAGHVGGEITENIADGRTAVWGTVTDWDPPALVGFTWHPGTPEDEATHVSVEFTATPQGTQVRLVHAGWGSRPDGSQARARYDSGWELVLGRYVALAG